MFRLIALITTFLISTGLHAKTISFLAFGDSGYHYDYLKPDVIKFPLTPAEFTQAKLDKWLEKHFPVADFQAPPIHLLPPTNQAIEASGMVPVATAMDKYCDHHDCQFGIMLGDNIYPNGATGQEDEERFRKMFEEPYKELVSKRAGFKLYAALGNHDWKTSRAGRDLQIAYGLRKDTAFTMKKPGYYSFIKGDVEFFVIDTNFLLATTVVKEEELNPDGSEKPASEVDVPEPWELPSTSDTSQIEWLTKALKSSKAKWKIVYGHHTLWSAGGSKFEEARALRKLIMPLMCKYADVYFAGHEHELEINTDSCLKENGNANHPLPLIISGAGAWQRAIHKPFQRFQTKKYPQYKSLWSMGMVWGFTHVEINNDVMTVKMITTPTKGIPVPVLRKTISFQNRSRKI